MKEKLKKLPPPLRKQALLRFARAGACFCLLLLVAVGYRQPMLWFPFLVMGIFSAGSGALFPIQPFVLTLFGTAGFLTWAVAGGLLQSFLRRHTRAFNGAMAAVLALCALDLLF